LREIGEGFALSRVAQTSDKDRLKVLKESLMAETDRLQELVAEVAAAYFSNSHVSPAEIPQVVQQIATSLAAVKSTAAEPEAAAEEPAAPVRKTPAQARKSITPDGLISFEDGKSYKTLKRHLVGRGLTPAQYREKWGLPGNYPMVSPNYSAARSQMAKAIGLGRKGSGGPKTRRKSAPAG
jgi:predicted transcriptional regulator